jgi:uncharacterized protein
MNFTEEGSSNGLTIQGYQSGRFLVGGKFHQSSLLVTPEQVSDWPVDAVEQVTADDFAQALALAPEIIIYGTGKRQVFPPSDIYANVINQGIGLEVMDTAAACRTYNILVSEGRRVAAILLMI